MTYHLPSLNALRAFEASARHLSFTRAAIELCVTQAAISHQVKGLEQRLYSGSTAASKDLLALQHEIKLLQEKQSGLEDKLLGQMEQVEAGQKALAAIDAELAEAEESLAS